MSDRLALAVEERGEVVVVRLTGELDLAVAPGTTDRVAEAVPASAFGLVLDLVGVSFIDSSGVAMLFTLVRRLENRRQALRAVVAPDSAVARVLDLVDFARAAPVVDDLEAAVAAIAGRG